MSGSWKGKKQERKEAGRGHWPFKSFDSLFNQMEKGLQQCRRHSNNGYLSLRLHLCDQKQQLEHRYPVFEGQGPFCLL